MSARVWAIAAGLAVLGLWIGASGARAHDTRRVVTVEVHASNSEANWDPSEVRIQPGESVYWSFDNPDVAHNVASSSPNWTYTTPVETNHPDTAPYTFTTAGVYTFICEVHPQQMFGTVIVGDVATPTPTATATQTATATATATVSATPTATPAPTVQAPPAPTATAVPLPAPAPTAAPPNPPQARDTVAPRLTSVHVKAIVHGAKVGLRLSEAATVTVTVKRGKTTLKSATAKLKAGRRTVTVRSSRIRHGRITVEVRARDAAGNRSSLRKSTVRA